MTITRRTKKGTPKKVKQLIKSLQQKEKELNKMVSNVNEHSGQDNMDDEMRQCPKCKRYVWKGVWCKCCEEWWHYNCQRTSREKMEEEFGEQEYICIQCKEENDYDYVKEMVENIKDSTTTTGKEKDQEMMTIKEVSVEEVTNAKKTNKEKMEDETKNKKSGTTKEMCRKINTNVCKENDNDAKEMETTKGNGVMEARKRATKGPESNKDKTMMKNTSEKKKKEDENKINAKTTATKDERKNDECKTNDEVKEVETTTGNDGIVTRKKTIKEYEKEKDKMMNDSKEKEKEIKALKREVQLYKSKLEELEKKFIDEKHRRMQAEEYAEQLSLVNGDLWIRVEDKKDKIYENGKKKPINNDEKESVDVQEDAAEVKVSGNTKDAKNNQKNVRKEQK